MKCADLALQEAKIKSWKWELATNNVESPGFSTERKKYSIKDFLKEVHPEDLKHVVQNLNQALFTNTYHDDGFRMLDREGDVNWYIGRGYLFYNEEDNEKIIIGFWIRIKDRDEVKLQPSQRIAKLAITAQLCAMREMVSILSHEISQPLTVISTYISGCIRRIQNNHLVDKQQIIDALVRANNHVELTGNLMHRIKDFIRKNELNYESVPLHRLIERAAALVVPDPNYPSTNIRYQFDKNIPNIEVDAIKIKIVILNLIVNGIESMYGMENHSSEVIVETVYENSDYFSLLIKDSGCGIPYDTRDKVFDACFSTKKNGVGMGLTISKGIIEEHKGHIAFYALANQGTCFKVTMPISPKVFTE